MPDQEKLKIVTDILGDYRKIGSEYLFFCKKCNHHKRKLSVNLEKDKFKCWVCDFSGNSIKRIVARFGNYLQLNKWNELSGIVEILEFDKIFSPQQSIEEVVHVKLPEEFESLCNKDVSLKSLDARRYLRDRGLSKEDILRWKIGYCSSGEYENRVIVPSFGVDGKLNYFVARTYTTKKYKKYMNPVASKDIIFNELYVDWSSPITLVEGAFDAIKADNAIPLLGSTLREGSKLFKEIVKNDPIVYIALDPDAEKKAEKLVSALLSYDVELYKIPIPNGLDVGDMSHEQFLEFKKQSTLFKDSDDILLRKIMSITL
jgi:DNA primase